MWMFDAVVISALLEQECVGAQEIDPPEPEEVLDREIPTTWKLKNSENSRTQEDICQCCSGQNTHYNKYCQSLKYFIQILSFCSVNLKEESI